jgi:hypothetical protein
LKIESLKKNATELKCFKFQFSQILKKNKKIKKSFEKKLNYNVEVGSVVFYDKNAYKKFKKSVKKGKKYYKYVHEGEVTQVHKKSKLIKVNWKTESNLPKNGRVKLLDLKFDSKLNIIKQMKKIKKNKTKKKNKKILRS